MEYCICSIYVNTTDWKKAYIILLKNPNFNTDNESVKGNKIRESNISKILWVPSV